MPDSPRPIRIDPDKVKLEPLDLDPAAFQSALPVQYYGLVFEAEEIGLAVGIWDTTTMQEAFGPYPGDEFITVLDGRFAMVDAAGNTLAAAGPGDSVTFRNGAPSSWKQDGYLRKVYLTLTPPDAEPPRTALVEGAFKVLPAKGLPEGQDQTLFRNDAGTMSVRIRTVGAGSEPAATALQHELIRVLAGELVLTDAAGVAQRFRAGDHVFLPAGTVVRRETRAGTTACHVLVTA